MELEELLRRVDHTLLKPEASWAQIREVIDDGATYRTASVCIPASYVRQAAEYAGGRVPVCTVIGFPCGYSTIAAKCFEAAEAVRNGAAEVDMVVNIGWVKDARWEDLLAEIRAVKEACGDQILKVIIETCLLSREEKIRMCELVSRSGADYIKTSTGFSTGGATREDIALFARHITGGVRIKAAGGIRTLQDAEDFIALGADRLGTSAVIRLVKEGTEDGKLSHSTY